MSEPITDEAFLAAHPEHAETAPAIRVQLREAEALKAELAEVQQANITLQKTNAFADAGLPAGDLRDLILKNYEGELTPEAILAEAKRFNLEPAAAPPPPPATPSTDAMRRIGAATAGAAAPPDAVASFEQRLLNAPTAEAFDRIMAEAPPELNVRLGGTVGGNRVI